MFSIWWVVFGAIGYWFWRYRAKTIPGLGHPPWTFWLGNLPVVLKTKDKIYTDMMERMHDDPAWGNACKTYFWSLPGNRAMIVAHPTEKNIRHLLKDRFDNYTMPQSRIEAFKELFGGGIFAVHGKEWLTQRKAASSIFTMRLMRESMTEVLLSHGQTFLARLKSVAESNSTIDIQDLFFRFTMDSFCEIAFGENLKCLETTEPHPFSRAFDVVQHAIMQRMMTSPLIWKFERVFGLGLESKLKEQLKVLNAQAYAFVKRRRDDMESGAHSKPNDLISHFLNAAKKEGSAYTDEQMRDMIMNFLVAGRDTTACALSWTVYELSRNPECLAKVVEEVDTIIGGVDTQPSFDAVAEMRYTEAVLLETLRLHPSVPVDSKQAVGDDVLPDGTHVPAGTEVTYNPITAGRAKCVWGEDAHDFKPARWLVDSKTGAGAEAKSPTNADSAEDQGSSSVTGGALTKVHSQYKYPTFNAGPRLCLGRGLALMEAKLLLSLILQHYTLEVIAGQDITYVVTITLMMKNGLKVKVLPRVRK